LCDAIKNVATHNEKGYIRVMETSDRKAGIAARASGLPIEGDGS
jgi:hypothetical protein